MTYQKHSAGKCSWNLRGALCLLAIAAVAFPLLLSPKVSGVHAQSRAATARVTVDKSTPELKAELQILPIKILFKWSGIIGPGGGGGGCNTPLGICITRGFSVANGALRREELEEGVGIALARIKGNRLYMVFTREAALGDGTVRISRDTALSSEVSRGLGYDRITLKAGVYKVDMSKRPFGETWVNIERGKDLPPRPMNTVTCNTYQNTTGYGSGCGVACSDGTSYPMSCSADIFKNN